MQANCDIIDKYNWCVCIQVYFMLFVSSQIIYWQWGIPLIDILDFSSLPLLTAFAAFPRQKWEMQKWPENGSTDLICFKLTFVQYFSHQIWYTILQIRILQNEAFKTFPRIQNEKDNWWQNCSHAAAMEMI